MKNDMMYPLQDRPTEPACTNEDPDQWQLVLQWEEERADFWASEALRVGARAKLETEELEARCVRLERARNADQAYASHLEGQLGATAVHFWQNDGEDHLESLCSGVPVVIEAQTLRELIAQAEYKAVPGRMTSRKAREKISQGPLVSVTGTEVSIYAMGYNACRNDVIEENE